MKSAARPVGQFQSPRGLELAHTNSWVLTEPASMRELRLHPSMSKPQCVRRSHDSESSIETASLETEMGDCFDSGRPGAN
jgi:hypothetical protein